MYFIIAVVIIVAIIGSIRDKRKEDRDTAFLDTHVLSMARELGMTELSYDRNGIFEDTIFQPCQFYPKCQHYQSGQMLTGKWHDIPFRTGYLNLTKDASTSEGESTQECITSGRLIEITVDREFPVWYAIAHQSYTTYGIPFSEEKKCIDKNYAIKMNDDEGMKTLNTIEPYREAIHKLINGKSLISFGFTGHTIYVFLHSVSVFQVAKKKPEDALRQELARITEVIDLMTQV